MNKRTARIKDGIRELARQPYEVLSGRMVSGSLDSAKCTIDVLPTNATTPITGVRLNTVTENGKGFVVYPKDGGHVIIMSVDGPGVWALVNASEISKVQATIGEGGNATTMTMTTQEVRFTQGAASVALKNGKLSFKNGSKDLNTILTNILQHIQSLTVTTGTGPSGPPINISDFVNDSLDLSQLLF